MKTRELGYIFDARNRIIGQIDHVKLVFCCSEVFHHWDLEATDVELALLQRIVKRSCLCDNVRCQSHSTRNAQIEYVRLLCGLQ